MKIYLNKNCSGYHWFECIISDCEEFILMNYAEPVHKSMPILRGLMLHSQYEICMACEKELYILSLNNLPEHRRIDEFGRPISLQIVFLSKNVEELWKILFYRLQYDKIFSDSLSKCFDSVMAADGQFVRCNVHLLDDLLNSCYAKGFSDMALKILSRNNEKLLYVNKRSRLVMNNIGFSEEEVEKAECNRTEHIVWLIDANIPGNESSKQIETVSQDLHSQEDISKGSSSDSSEETEDVHIGDDLKQNTINLSSNKHENGALSVNNDLLNNQIEHLRGNLQESERQIKILKADLVSSESMSDRISAEMKRELMKFKFFSIILGISFIVLLVLYIIK